MALALASLVALVVAVSFPFVRFEVGLLSNRIDLTQTATSLLDFQQPLVAIAVVLTILVLPALYLVGVIWLQAGLLRGRRLPLSRSVARSLTHLTPWMMADVFIIGALVSMIKVAGDADVELGIGFLAFCAFAALLLLTTQSLERESLWFLLGGEPPPPTGTRSGLMAAAQGLAGCPTCGLINALEDDGRALCPRCGENVRARDPHGLQRTWALLAAAAVLYIPANLYPMMTTSSLGETITASIIGGVAELWHMGSWGIAIIIFVASVVVPVVKLVVLAWLCLKVGSGAGLDVSMRTRLYRIVEFIGRWSMVDVFVLAILVALIGAGTLMSVTPGPAALAFAAVVVLTMLAAISFDPRLLWDAEEAGSGAEAESANDPRMRVDPAPRA